MLLGSNAATCIKHPKLSATLSALKTSHMRVEIPVIRIVAEKRERHAQIEEMFFQLASYRISA